MWSSLLEGEMLPSGDNEETCELCEDASGGHGPPFNRNLDCASCMFQFVLSLSEGRLVNIIAVFLCLMIWFVFFACFC